MYHFPVSLIVLQNKGKSTILFQINSSEVLPSAADKAKLFVKNVSGNSDLDGSGISLPVFPSRTNLKQHDISVTPKLVKKANLNQGWHNQP